ncbi:flagellar filament capping protein FliD [Bradyrhizobium prioriisuperbiae]|uniref:flagellar filament capping protein FliD n=1 Tax=Bradyrhizobium prioriisuperbiae TaxID=2854389 RepID=UPI0028E68F46|nr:flagellar filament capping protein FliD [Bradyrhizobium prioritasuperba]
MTVSSATSSSTSSSSASTVTTTGTTTSTSLDWSALITAQVNAKLAAATSIQTTITANEAKITAYQQLQTLLSTLSSGLTSLNSSIVNSLATNAFASRSATITATGDVSASSALGMSVSNGAATGDHTLEITQLATAHKVIGSAQSSQSTALGYSGSFSLGLSGGTSATISVTSDMSLLDIVDAVNAQTSTTNVQASVVQVSSGEYELVLSGTQDAADIVTSSTSGSSTDILNALGVTDSSGAFTDVLQTAQSAIISLDGITITRDTNDITDVLSGVTFNLLQATPSGTSLNISIGTNTSQIESAIETFVTDYNAFRDYVVTQQAQNSDGTAASSAVLFGDGTMRDIMTQLQQALSTSLDSLSMSDLGLSFNTSNELVLDSSALETSLSSNLSGLTSLLAAQTTTSSGQLNVVNSGTSPPSSFTLDIEVDSSGNLTSASVGGDSSMFSVSGKTIIGASGTAYAGMAFTYSGTTSQSVTVTSTTGIAAQIYNIAKNFSNTTSGALQTLISGLQTQDTTLEQKVSDIQANAATYQTMLQNQYAQYQAAIQSANNTLNYLTALLDASSNN